MGDFSDDYGGYDVLGLYEQRDDDRRAQRAKLLTPQRTWVGLTTAQRKEIERQSVYVEGAIRMTEAKLKKENT
jgi:hypothetical protein